MSQDEDAKLPEIGPVKRISTDQLFEGTREIAIDHNGHVYRLRVTAKGRLILTK